MSITCYIIAHCTSDELTRILSCSALLASSVIPFNVHSLCRHWGDFVNLLTIVNHHFLVTCLSETWLGQSGDKFLTLSGYHVEYSHRLTDHHS